MILSKKTKRDGFTLFELMIALMVLGGIMALLYPMIQNYRISAELRTTKMALSQLKNAISIYKGDIGEYPNKLQDLVRKPADPKAAAKWVSAYVDESHIDKEELQYRRTPGGKHPYELTHTSEYSEEPISVWQK